MTNLPSIFGRLVTAAMLPFLLVPVLSAQDGGPGNGGLAELAQQRRYLDNHHRVLLIAAHPDDEDTELLTILSRGMGVRTAYLSLTRGEGGQNLIGDELGAALGVVRASELVAARAIDGGQQYFTRAFDFGFSKTAEETFRFWPRDSVLKDVVRVIRQFRPHVIVSMFSGTPRDGHGHHQVAGILAREGFDVAGDPTRFPELRDEEGLPAWTPYKFYRDYRVSDGITLDGGVIDAATGHSLHQIAMRSRSQHRSQDMGRLEELGPSQVTIQLEARAAGMPDGPDTGIFDGVPADSAKHDNLRRSLRLSEGGVIFDAYVDDNEVAPGQRLQLNLLAWNTGRDPVVARMGWQVPTGFSQDSVSACSSRDVTVRAGQLFRCVVPISVDADAAPHQPYYLREAMQGSLYTWSGDVSYFGTPFDPGLRARIAVRFADSTNGGRTIDLFARSLDQGLGEIRSPVTVVPPVLLDLSPGRFIWPAGERARMFRIDVENASRDSITAAISLLVPDGWQVDNPQEVHFTTEGERRTLQFRVTAPEEQVEQEVSFLAQAKINGISYRLGVRRIDYPHIRERLVFHLADATAVVAPVEFPAGRRIGYLRGAADRIPEALAAAGVPFRLLTDSDLTGPALDSLDVLVLGPRSYETSVALQRAHPRVLKFAEDGGTLIVQYQQYQFVRGNFAPLPLDIARPHDRITDETAPVRWLPGSEQLQQGPNRLEADDFDDWVQERGLYFASTWDDRWQPMLEMDEPGEAPRRGGLLIAPYGEGTVVYTGIAFFRQLPAAVPGAWRLFANLLAQ